MSELTVLILTKNEEIDIERCIRSCDKVAKRFVIVDSYSNDRTEQICRTLSEEYKPKGIGVDFYKNCWIDYATQFNWGINNTSINTKWILRIDADEYLTAELSDEICENLDMLEPSISGIEIKRRVVFMGKWLKHGGMYPRYFLRIFKIGYGECERRKMDEHIVVSSGKVIRFKYDIVDENKKDLTWWTNKHNSYSSREMMDYCNKEIERNNVDKLNLQAKIIRYIKVRVYYKLPLFFRAKMHYILRYYFLLGFLDGKQGKIFHFLQAYWYRFLVDAKIFEKLEREIRDKD